MRRHEVSYHEDIDSISFKSEYCNHLEVTTHLKEKVFASMKISIESIQKMKSSKETFSSKEFVFESQIIFRRSDFSIDSQVSTSSSSSASIREKSVDLAMISVVIYKMSSQQKDVQLFSISLKDVNEHLKKSDEKKINSASILSKKYLEFLDVFSKVAFNELSSHRDIDHQIILKEDKHVDHEYCSLYNMSIEKLVTVKKYLEKNLKKEFITISFSLFVSSILFAKKSNDQLRFCVNYRKLNFITRKNRYSLSLIDETLTQLSKIKIFTRLNIRQTFHRVRIREENENLTIFRTRFESYKYRVMSFELINESAIYQHYMNDILFDLLDKFVTTYFDDILIYSQNLKEHRDHVKKILERLRAAELQMNINKYEFDMIETKFLELIVKKNEIRMNLEKIRTIMK